MSIQLRPPHEIQFQSSGTKFSQGIQFQSKKIQFQSKKYSVEGNSVSVREIQFQSGEIQSGGNSVWEKFSFSLRNSVSVREDSVERKFSRLIIQFQSEKFSFSPGKFSFSPGEFSRAEIQSTDFQFQSQSGRNSVD